MNPQRRQWLQRAAASGGAALLAPVLAGCRGRAPLTVAYHPWPGYATLKLAEHLGWWQGTPLRSLATGSASASRAALAEDRAQAAALTLDEVLVASAQGLALTVVFVFNLSYGADVVLARPSHREPARWPGARLGYEPGAVGELMAEAWLRHAGLDEAALRVVPLAFDQHEAAWQAEQVDLLVTSEPVASRLEEQGALRLFDSTQLPPQTPIVDVLAVRRDALAARRAALQTLVRSLLQGLKHLQMLPGDAALRLGPWLGLPSERVIPSFRGLRLQSWQDNRAWLGVGAPAHLYKAAAGLATFLHAHGRLPQPRPPTRLVTGSLLPAKEPPW